MKGLVVRHRTSGYTRTIIPFDEDYEYWYATEIKGKKIVETLRYSKREFDFMGEKWGSLFFLMEQLKPNPLSNTCNTFINLFFCIDPIDHYYYP